MRRASIVLLALLLAAFSVVRIPASIDTLIFEAESYATISAPMRVAHGDAKASGGAFVELPPGSGQGWRGQGGGTVTYRADLPQAGTYALWARARWNDGCTNAFFLSANGATPVVVGNDAIFGAWHWVKGQSMTLHEGLNYLRFANHSDGTALDKLVLTNDPRYLPEGLGEGITHFFDGFAGCDADNTGSWDFPSGKWRVIHAAGSGVGSVNDCLAQWSPQGGLALGGFSVWREYDARVKVMLSAPGTVALLFYYAGAQDTCRLVWESGEKTAVLRLERATVKEVRVLAETSTPLRIADHWYELGYSYGEGHLVCSLDGQPLLDVQYDGSTEGKIGLETVKSGGVYFDNVQVQFDRNDATGSISGAQRLLGNRSSRRCETR